MTCTLPQNRDQLYIDLYSVTLRHGGHVGGGT